MDFEQIFESREGKASCSAFLHQSLQKYGIWK